MMMVQMNRKIISPWKRGNSSNYQICLAISGARSGAGWADRGQALARHRRRSRGAATLRGLFGSYGSITRHSKSVGSNRLVQKLLSETLNQNDTALGN